MNAGKRMLAEEIASRLANMSNEGVVSLLVATFESVELAARNTAATSIALAEESIRAGAFYETLAAKLATLLRSNGEPILPVIEALANVERAARIAAAPLDTTEVMTISSERMDQLKDLREALAGVEIARREGARAAAH
jgi:hypothetical protein